MKLLIIDANAIHKVFVPGNPAYADLHAALIYGEKFNITAVHGGKLTQEYGRVRALRRVLVELNRAGRLRLFPLAAVQSETKRVESHGICNSDDAHIIALARVSTARILCSDDRALCTDFTTKALIDRPRGKVYRGIQHNRLLS